MNRFPAWSCYVHALRQASTGAASRPARQRLPTRRFFYPASLRPSYLGPKPAAQRLRTATTMAGVPQPKFAAGSEETALASKLRPLLASEGGRWGLTGSGEGIERSFKFKTFAKTWDFMTAVSLQCKLKNHHPEWSNVYNVTFIRWTTHNPQGLSAKDVELAAICDSLAKDFGEVVEPQQDPGSSCELRRLADTVTAGAGDCCTPKPKA